MLQILLSPDPFPDTATTRVLRIGSDANDPAPTDQYLRVTSGDAVRLDIELRYNDQEARAFFEAIIWQGLVVIGWCERLYLVNPQTREVTEHRLGAYFGRLYPEASALFVSSAERVFRVDQHGAVAWRSEVLGLDGVLIHDITDTELRGEGEWDAPGGWQAFAISADTGGPQAEQAQARSV